MRRSLLVVLTTAENSPSAPKGQTGIILTDCLATVHPRHLQHRLRLAIDPGATCQACREAVAWWRGGLDSINDLVLLLHNGGGATFHRHYTPPELFWPGRTTVKTRQRDRFGKGKPLTRARAAWEQRREILSCINRERHALEFLLVACSRADESLTVPEAAKRLKLSVRQLSRLCTKDFGYPPGVLLDLARIVSVVQGMEGGAITYAELARGHRFTNESALYRLFRRFVGVSPGAYRSAPQEDISHATWPKRTIQWPKRTMDTTT